MEVQQSLSKRATRVLAAIIAASDKTLKYVELQYLADTDRKTLHRALKELREKNYIADNGQRGKTTTYEVLH